MLPLQQKLTDLKALLRREYLAPHPWPWVLGFSGGKDSTLMAHFVVEFLKSISPNERRRPVTFVSNDTRVESPIFQTFVDRQLATMGENLKALRLPVTVHKTSPSTEGSFWVRMLGKGYPAPSPTFRWCTNHMKVRPTGKFLQDTVSQHGGVILLLGIRRSESAQRAKTMARHDLNSQCESLHLTPHTEIKGCNVFAPLSELSTEEVWALLVQMRPPWGGSYRELIDLYRDAHTGECPFVISDSDQASCGSSNARFGCWTCTVVKKDRALLALAESQDDDSLEELNAFRERLKSVSDNPDYRSMTRRNGTFGPGPLTLDARRILLNELISLQQRVEKVLITEDEVRAIEHHWREDELLEIKRAVTSPINPANSVLV